MNLPRTMTALDKDSSPQSPDFDSFLITDDDDCISFEEMSDITHQSSPPPCNDLEPSLFDVDDSEITSLWDYFDGDEDIIDDSEYDSIKSEDLWESDWSSQSTESSLEQSDTSTQPDSPPPTTQPPEFDQLHNLPHEIVERPRYFPQ
jgi:hypothetical protein